MKSPKTKKYTESNNMFLSGEADPELQAHLTTKLMNHLTISARDKGFQDDDNCLAGYDNNNGNSKKIVVVDETTTSKNNQTDAKPPTNSLNMNCSSSSDEDDDDDNCPPPIVTSTSASSSSRIMNDIGRQTKNKMSGRLDKAVPSIRNNDDNQGPSLMEQMMKEASASQTKKQDANRVIERQNAKKASFSGFQKGFLTKTTKTTKNNNNKNNKPKKDVSQSKPLHPSNPKKETTVYELDDEGNLKEQTLAKEHDDEIPFIRHSNIDSLRMEQVQNALNSPLESLLSAGGNGELGHQDLMEKLSKNPRLMTGFQNPKFMAAMEAMRENPKEAMEKIQNHPDILEFIQEYCAVIGANFTALGEKEEKKTSSREKLGPMAKRALEKEEQRTSQGMASWDQAMGKEDKERLDAIMSDSDLTSLLMDPDMQKVMQECSMPGRIHRYMRDPEFAPKLKKLMEAGLLRMC